MEKMGKNIATLAFSVGLVAVIILGVRVMVTSLKTNEKEQMQNTQFITIEQSDDLWLQYDKDTNIVFMVQQSASYGRGAYLRIPYPAKNGLPYRYNEETEELEMIMEK